MSSMDRIFSKKSLKPIYQSENSECGLACLVMISNYLYSTEQNLRNVRTVVGSKSEGATLDDLVSYAQRLGMLPKAISLEENELDLVSLPAILHWNMNHFVVLEKVSKNHCTIIDPVHGRLKLSRPQFLEQFTGIALELSKIENFVLNAEFCDGKLRARDFFSSISGIKNSVLKLVSFSLVTQFFAIGTPLYTQFTIDNVIQNGDEELLIIISFGIIMVVLLEQLVLLFHRKLGLYISTILEYQLSSSLFFHTLTLSASWFKGRSIGDIISKFGSLKNIQSFITSAIVSVFIDLVSLIVSLSIMLVYSPILTLVSTLFLVFSHVIKLSIFPIQKNLASAGIIKSAKQQSEFVESIRSFQTIKSLSLEANRFTRWSNCYTDTLNNSVKNSNINFYQDFILAVISGFEYVIIIYICTGFISDGIFSLGMFFSFLSFKGRFVNSFNSLLSMYFKKEILNIHLDRVSDVALEIADVHSGLDIISINSIEVRDLSLNVYKNNSLGDKLSFSVNKGDKLVITGNSGAGKTTLLNILSGNIRSYQGDIIVNGHSMKSLDSKLYRKCLSSVFHDDVLFSGSLIENITAFDSNPDYEFAIKCAEISVCHEFINSFPMKFETIIGDLGATLSSGQKQRVMLARALYQKPSLLLLDEATSFLDSSLEDKVLCNIENLGITVIAVAHRSRAKKMSSTVIDLPKPS
ncbi:peptidase domain-containing ABC transporter [Vibrio vulnificus]|nr:peptidase domain-containing ABC transporter [Vibrio vulnificus]EHU4997221.1 peptidase domain-containing ABC transporter [Vibrio vulnificus]